MLDNFSIFVKTEKIHGDVFVTTRPGLVSMQCNQIMLRYGPDKFDAFAGIVPRHFFEVVDESLLTIAYRRIMLYVFCTLAGSPR